MKRKKQMKNTHLCTHTRAQTSFWTIEHDHFLNRWLAVSPILLHLIVSWNVHIVETAFREVSRNNRNTCSSRRKNLVVSFHFSSLSSVNRPIESSPYFTLKQHSYKLWAKLFTHRKICSRHFISFFVIWSSSQLGLHGVF